MLAPMPVKQNVPTALSIAHRDYPLEPGRIVLKWQQRRTERECRGAARLRGRVRFTRYNIIVAGQYNCTVTRLNATRCRLWRC